MVCFYMGLDSAIFTLIEYESTKMMPISIIFSHHAQGIQIIQKISSKTCLLDVDEQHIKVNQSRIITV